MMSSQQNDKRDERAAEIVNNFKKIMAMLYERRATIENCRKTLMLAIGTSTAHISYAIVEIAIDSVAAALKDFPKAWKIKLISKMVNRYYFDMTAKRAPPQLLERARQKIVYNLRNVFNEIGMYQRVCEEIEWQKFMEMARGLGGETYEIARRALGQPIDRQISREMGEDNEPDEAIEAGDDDQPIGDDR